MKTTCLFLIGCTCFGCSPATSDPSADKTRESVDKALDKVGSEIHKQRETVKMELRERAVSFLVDGLHDDQHIRALYSKIEALSDPGADNHSFKNCGAYYQSDTCFFTSPITDMETAVANIDFGLVLAVDPNHRVVLIDVSEESNPRPFKDQPGAEVIKEYVLRKTATFAASRVDTRLVERFGGDNVVVVWMPDQPGTNPKSQPVVTHLRELAPETRAANYTGFGPRNSSFAVATVAPVNEFSQVVEALEGETILAADEEQRVVILGELAELMPETHSE